MIERRLGRPRGPDRWDPGPETGGLDPQQRQEDRYRIPYHHVPTLAGGGFRQHLYWHWGFRYLGGIHLVLQELEKLGFESLIDIGCGDGRFLAEVRGRHPDRRLLGVDHSARAIELARALVPGVDFQRLDITETALGERYDVGTLIEVLEHIPPPALGRFLDAVPGLLRDRHTLIVTVPHRNAPLAKKHYQHFDQASLQALLGRGYRDLTFIPFDVPARQSIPLWLLSRLIGGKGRVFVLTDRRILSWFFRLYLRRYLYAPGESACERIAVICRR